VIASDSFAVESPLPDVKHWKIVRQVTFFVISMLKSIYHPTPSLMIDEKGPQMPCLMRDIEQVNLVGTGIHVMSKKNATRLGHE